MLQLPMIHEKRLNLIDTFFKYKLPKKLEKFSFLDEENFHKNSTLLKKLNIQEKSFFEEMPAVFFKGPGRNYT